MLEGIRTRSRLSLQKTLHGETRIQHTSSKFTKCVFTSYLNFRRTITDIFRSNRKLVSIRLNQLRILNIKNKKILPDANRKLHDPFPVHISFSDFFFFFNFSTLGNAIFSIFRFSGGFWTVNKLLTLRMTNQTASVIAETRTQSDFRRQLMCGISKLIEFLGIQKDFETNRLTKIIIQ